jgi:uncharacterized protein (DUF433 family)
VEAIPVVSGTKVPAQDIVDALDVGVSPEEILESEHFRGVTEDDLLAITLFAFGDGRSVNRVSVRVVDDD